MELHMDMNVMSVTRMGSFLTPDPQQSTEQDGYSAFVLSWDPNSESHPKAVFAGSCEAQPRQGFVKRARVKKVREGLGLLEVLEIGSPSSQDL